MGLLYGLLTTSRSSSESSRIDGDGDGNGNGNDEEGGCSMRIVLLERGIYHDDDKEEPARWACTSHRPSSSRFLPIRSTNHNTSQQHQQQRRTTNNNNGFRWKESIHMAASSSWNGKLLQRLNYFELLVQPLLTKISTSTTTTTAAKNDNPNGTKSTYKTATMDDDYRIEEYVGKHNKNIQIIVYQNAVVEQLKLDSSLQASSPATQTTTTTTTTTTKCSGVYCRPNTTKTNPPNNNNCSKSSLLLFAANKKVILCAGAIYTPALLLASSSYIRNQQQNGTLTFSLRDHFVIPRTIFLKWPFFPKNNHNHNKDDDDDDDERHDYLNRINSIQAYSGPITCRITGSSHDDDGNHHTLDLKYAFGIMDGYAAIYTYPVILSNILSARCYYCATMVQTILYWIFTILFQYIPIIKWFLQYCTSTLLIYIYNPSSTGTVTLRYPPHTNSNNKDRQQQQQLSLSQVDICIDPPYDKVLTNTQDTKRIQTLVTPWKLQPAFQNVQIHGWDMFSPSYMNSFYDKYIAHQLVQPFFHYTGTCAMPLATTTTTKLKQNTIVDQALNVRGISNLQICDASVIPTHISAPTALTCAALGYVASTLIFEEHSDYNINMKKNNEETTHCKKTV